MNKFATFVGGVLFGAAIGAVTALLMAPKSGEEMRKDIQERYESTRDEVQTRANEARSQFQARAEETRSAIEQKAQAARESILERKQRVPKTTETQNENSEKVAA